MNKKRQSYHLTQLLNELRKRAIAVRDEDKRNDYWRLFFKAQRVESEVREMVMDAEIRRLLDFALAYGRLPDDWKDEADKPDDNQPPLNNDIDDGDISPRQKGLWDYKDTNTIREMLLSPAINFLLKTNKIDSLCQYKP